MFQARFSPFAAICFSTLVFSLASPAAFAGSGPGGAAVSAEDSVAISVSKDLKHVLLTDGFSAGLRLLDTDSGKVTVISKSGNSGVFASISGDGKSVCYKRVENTQHVPVVYDIASGKNTALAPPSPEAGTPAVGGGLTAFTLGNELIVLNADGSEKAVVDLGHHVNLLAISADGSSIAYNDPNHQIVTIDVATGAQTQVTDGNGDYWGPQFSPDGAGLLASSVDARVVVSSKNGKAAQVGVGEGACWANNDEVAFAKKERVHGKGVVKTDIIAANVKTGKSRTISSEEGNADAALSSGNIVVSKSGSKSVKYGYIGNGALLEKEVPAGGDDRSAISNAPGADQDVADSQNVVDTTSYKYLSNMPYIHQNNDSPDWWNGNSSCSATAALMAINYFYIMPKRPITCSWPTVHTSDYGFYIPEKYSFNGYSYSTYGSVDYNGNVGYGGFGFITRNNWVDTKSYMRDFIIQHGPTSAVDWSPTFAKAKAEIDANKPSVLLNSLTSAGHYIVTTGYYKSQYTLIFNDPYGNKNSGSYPSDNGVGVRYDWPGYNYGYMNLNTVHCYIYCRFGQPSAPSGVTATAASSSQINLAWTDNSSCEQYYDVFRSTTSGSGYAKIATVGANVKSYSNTGLAAATTYYYVVQARNPSGSSANSNQASAKTSGSAPPADQIIDNASASFTASTSWSTGTSAADKYGTNYRFRSTQAISDAAVWNFSISQARNYEIYAWWSAGTNRSATAPYVMPDGVSVAKNQQTGGGAWQSLGIKNLATGSKTVKLSCWTTTGYVVVADAIKVVAR